VLTAASLGGIGFGDGVTMGAQVMAQIKGVIVTILWSGIGSLILLYITKAITGLRVSEDAERQGLDLTSHGESAYHS